MEGMCIEVQWKARIDHPFGWWLGQVKSSSPEGIVVDFVQYPDTSVWRSLELPFCARKPSVAISNGCILGCVFLSWQHNSHTDRAICSPAAILPFACIG